MNNFIQIIIIAFIFIFATQSHAKNDFRDDACQCNFKKNEKDVKGKCFTAVGAQCNADALDKVFLGKIVPQYDYETCEVEAYVTSGSEKHDICCSENKDKGGVACNGWPTVVGAETSFYTNKPCFKEWNEAKLDVKKANDDDSDDVGTWKLFGPYYKDEKSCKKCMNWQKEQIDSGISSPMQQNLSLKILDNNDCVISQYTKSGKPSLVLHKKDMSITAYWRIYQDGKEITLPPRTFHGKDTMVWKESINCCRIFWNREDYLRKKANKTE